jgi:anti-anti-sigma regulatory factor
MGLAVLARFHRTAAETGQRFALLGPHGDVLRVLKLVHFDRFLYLYPPDREISS